MVFAFELRNIRSFMHASCSKRPKGPKGRGEYESCDLHFAEGVSLILGAAYRYA